MPFNIDLHTHSFFSGDGISSPEDLIAAGRAKGLHGIAIPPHPYDLFRAGIRLSTLETLPIDAIEVFNAATTLRRYNRYAFKYAQIRGLPMTAASDAHHAATVGTAYTIVNTEDFSVKGILAQIVKSNELTQKYQTPRDSLRQTWNNWLRLRQRKRIPKLAAKDRSHNGH